MSDKSEGESKKDIISAIELEIIFDNTYDKFLTFSDIEKYLIQNFRFSGIKNYNLNLFEGINFFAKNGFTDLVYLVLNYFF